ncbi:MAG: anaerobic ribonucleoside-triphosphate reductase activating protein [Erysipelotrichaceae bacterium]|nr:anaerobic ribonucleoside-triphosphate reductase activating protein [Erysipelotrichaceae bacterium]
MKIHGLQKMTLLDFPGRVACTVFTGFCDMRCPFCHNYELVDGSAPAIMTSDELFSFLSKRKGLLDGVAITGGEPCLNEELPDLLRKIRDMGFQTKLDTNGNHPQMLKRILDEGLIDYAAMDVKNSRAKYAMTIGLSRFDTKNIEESIDLLKHSDIDYEFRTTVVHEFHEDADFEEIGQMIPGAKHYFLQCFTDRDTVPFGNLTAPAQEDLERYAEIVRKYVKDTQIRGMD